VKAIVLVKQVPRPDSIEFDQETKALKREGVPLLLNPFDAAAVTAAAGLGAEVVAMTMGPPQAEEALRQCLALGADRAIHLSDRVFAVADTIGTSRTLAMAIEKEAARTSSSAAGRPWTPRRGRCPRRSRPSSAGRT
jgi:electron transfer flavoprotein alpha/beta subunit